MVKYDGDKKDYDNSDWSVVSTKKSHDWITKSKVGFGLFCGESLFGPPDILLFNVIISYSYPSLSLSLLMPTYGWVGSLALPIRTVFCVVYILDDIVLFLTQGKYNM